MGHIHLVLLSFKGHILSDGLGATRRERERERERVALFFDFFGPLVMIFKNILLSLFVVVMYGTWRTRLVPTSSHWGPLRMIVINVYVCAYFRPSAFFGTNHIKNISYACFFVLHRSYIITLDLQNYLSVFSLFIMRHLCCVVFPAIRRLNLRVLSDSVFHVRNLSSIPGSFSAFSVDLFSISFRPSNSIFLALRRK